ncbi:hypothetical protein HMPREF9129_0961, partial [Peptoniphilus indolicus ATCC 29427]
NLVKRIYRLPNSPTINYKIHCYACISVVLQCFLIYSGFLSSFFIFKLENSM